MARLRYNGVTATLGADLLTAGTTITFAAALTYEDGSVPTITGTDYIPLILMDAAGQPEEIVHLASYTSGATTGTVTRAQESTTATDHTAGAKVIHGPTAADFASSGGGFTQSYVGTDSTGTGTELAVSNRVYLKKITLASAGLLTAVEAYVNTAPAGKVDSFAVALHSDSAGAPGPIIGANTLRSESLLTTGAASASPGRWFGLGLGRWLTAGDYWIGVTTMTDTDVGLQIGTTAGGADRYYTSGGSWLADGGFYTATTTTTNYSIRAALLT